MSKQTILERMKADDLWVKADDLWVKADDPGLKQTISRAQSRRAYLKSDSVKANDLKGRKQMILLAKTDDPT